jgi:hypothetical protein
MALCLLRDRRRATRDHARRPALPAGVDAALPDLPGHRCDRAVDLAPPHRPDRRSDHSGALRLGTLDAAGPARLPAQPGDRRVERGVPARTDAAAIRRDHTDQPPGNHPAPDQPVAHDRPRRRHRGARRGLVHGAGLERRLAAGRPPHPRRPGHHRRWRRARGYEVATGARTAVAEPDVRRTVYPRRVRRHQPRVARVHPNPHPPPPAGDPAGALQLLGGHLVRRQRDQPARAGHDRRQAGRRAVRGRRRLVRQPHQRPRRARRLVAQPGTLPQRTSATDRAHSWTRHAVRAVGRTRDGQPRQRPLRTAGWTCCSPNTRSTS